MRATSVGREGPRPLERPGDAHPDPAPGAVEHEHQGPPGFEELGCPDEIDLELAERAADLDLWTAVTDAMHGAALSADSLLIGYDGWPEWADDFVVTKQAEDCWYAGMVRGRRLVLRRI